MLKFFKPVMLIAFLASAALSGCEKKEIEVVAKNENVKVTEISELKIVFAKLVNIDVEEVSFNEESRMFVMFGVDQISFSDLKKYHEQSK